MPRGIYNVLPSTAYVAPNRLLKASTLLRNFSVNVRLYEHTQASSLAAKIDYAFEDKARTAYNNKTSKELFRALAVFKLCSSDYLVQNNQKILKASKKYLGGFLHNKLMNATFYGQFVIGQEEKAVSPIVQRYIKDGVNPILYFAMEEDKSASKTSITNDPFYENNVRKFKESVDITSKTAGGSGYIAVKPTALCSPNLWVKLTQVIKQKTPDAMKKSCSVDLDTDFLSFLTAEESAELNKLMERAQNIIQYAALKEVGVMIDAEQTYFQPAIQRFLGLEMMKMFNKERVNVMMTYQTYLKAADVNIKNHMEFCMREKICFGARVVRGAYLDQERDLARNNGYDDPTNPSFEDTTAMYHRVAELVLENMKNRGHGYVKVMFATHNEDSIRFLLERLKVYNPPLSCISFGQLYGMCDHITFHLGQTGFPAYKSMPFGPIELVTSYLGRRAIENRGVLDKVKKERKLLARELKGRLFKMN